MKYYYLAIITLLTPSLCFAENRFGISGAIGTSNELRIVSQFNQMVVEPYFAYRNTTNRKENETDITFENYKVGLGLWMRVNHSPKLYSHIGFQAGYSNQEYTGGFATRYDDGVSGSIYTEALDGFHVAPGIGLFYALNAHIDAGIEVKYQYQQLEGTKTSQSAGYPDYSWEVNPDAELEQKNHEVITQAVLKIYF